jgi:hypothetical protein
MATTDTLNVKLTADTDGYASKMSQAERSTKSFGDAAKNNKKSVEDFGKEVKDTSEDIEEFGEKSQKAGKKAENSFSDLKRTIVSLGIGQLIKTSITDAMNAFESESLFETSMGAWVEQARSWSEQLSSSLGLDPYALRQSVGTLFTMTQSMGMTEEQAYSMSTSLVELAGDMASFYNMSFDDAFSKLRSGLTGEAEPLKALGVLIDEQTIKQVAYRNGIAKTGEELTQQEKVLARYQAIVEQTGTAQGDLARTIDSPANQLRITMNELKQASIEFGTALMPIVQAALPVLRGVITDLKPVVTDVAAGISYLSSGLELLENPSLRAIGYTVAIAVAMNKLKLAVGGPLSAVILLGTALSWLVGKFGETEQDVGENISGIADASKEATDTAKKSADELGKSYQDNGEKIKGMLAGFDEITKLSGNATANLVTSADVANAENVNEGLESASGYLSDIEKQVNDIFNNHYTMDASISEIGLPEVDWNVVMTNFKEWVKSQDWNKAWQDVGTAFQNVFEMALSVADGLFGTQLSKWYERITKDAFNYGFELEKAVNPADEGLQALDKYEKEHGTSAWLDFYNKVTKEGMSAKEAYNTVYTDINLQKGFAAYGADLASYYIPELQGKSTEEILKYLVPEQERRAGDVISQSFMIENPNIIGMAQSMAYDRYQNELDDPNSWLSALQGIDNMRKNPLRSKFIANSRTTNAVTTDDVVTLVQGMSNANFTGPIQIHNIIELDGDKVGENVTNYQDGQVSVTNGKQ